MDPKAEHTGNRTLATLPVFGQFNTRSKDFTGDYQFKKYILLDLELANVRELFVITRKKHVIHSSRKAQVSRLRITSIVRAVRLANPCLGPRSIYDDKLKVSIVPIQLSSEPNFT
jgi:hypothetical protein